MTDGQSGTVNFKFLRGRKSTKGMNTLDALAGYGTEAFLKVFYEHMGKAYLEPHEKALITMFEKIGLYRANISVIDTLKKDAQEKLHKLSVA